MKAPNLGRSMEEAPMLNMPYGRRKEYGENGERSWGTGQYWGGGGRIGLCYG